MACLRHRGPGRNGSIYIRRIALWVALFVGLCEMLTTTPSIPWDRVPGWLAVPVTMTGFIVTLVLFGFIGNAAIGLLLLFALRGAGCPLPWAALATAPFWIVFYRLCPKPW